MIGRNARPGDVRHRVRGGTDRHLVLSTLHTNNAPETLTRLLRWRMNPLNISDAFSECWASAGAAALSNCIESYRPSEEEFADLRTGLRARGLSTPPGQLRRRVSLKRRPVREVQRLGFQRPYRDSWSNGGHLRHQDLIKKNATSYDLAQQAAKDG